MRKLRGVAEWDVSMLGALISASMSYCETATRVWCWEVMYGEVKVMVILLLQMVD